MNLRYVLRHGPVGVAHRFLTITLPQFVMYECVQYLVVIALEISLNELPDY